MCPHGYHHSGSMATPALGTRDVRFIYIYIYIYTKLDLPPHSDSIVQGSIAYIYVQVEVWNYRSCLSALTQSCPVSPFYIYDLLYI